MANKVTPATRMGTMIDLSECSTASAHSPPIELDAELINMISDLPDKRPAVAIYLETWANHAHGLTKGIDVTPLVLSAMVNGVLGRRA